MNKPKILVTGGAGYIGSHVVKRLLEKNYQVVVIDNLSRGHRQALPKNIAFYKADVGDKKVLNKIFQTEKIQAVMHFAAFAYVDESIKKPGLYFKNNVLESLVLLETMVLNNVPYLIFSSSCVTFGLPKTKLIKENHPQNPVSPYGESKLAIEKTLKEYANNFNFKYITLRYFNAAGADDSGKIGSSHNPETRIIPLVLQHLLGLKKEIRIFGQDYSTPDGTCVRDFIHVNDLAEAHSLALNYLMKKTSSDHFNLGTGHGHSVLEIIRACEKITGLTADIKFCPRRPGDPPVLVADPGKAKKILRWRPRYSLEKIIATAWRWEKQRKY